MDLDLLGITTQTKNRLIEKGINNVLELLKFFPRKYYDFRNPIKVKDIKDGEYAAIIGKVIEVKNNTKKKFVMAKVYDGTGYIYITWFGNNRVAYVLRPGEEFIFCGKTIIDKNFNYMKKMQPLYFSAYPKELQKIIPVYSKIKGISDNKLNDMIKHSLSIISNREDFIGTDIKKEFSLIHEVDAFKLIHNPKTMEDINKAKLRFIFDDLFCFNFQLKYENQNYGDSKSKYSVSTCKSWHTLYGELPFEFTEDQKYCLKRIFNNMRRGNRINSLVMGDVGSGKTIVATFLLATSCENGFQSTLVAPTSVLAQQHFNEIEERFKSLPYNIAYLSGNTKASEKKKILKGLKDGSIHCVVGTHAIFQKDVEFNNLGLVIIDEQHRFGVEQREFFKRSSKEMPHVVNMTATPIPRTLAMGIYGDHIDIVTIKTKPKGRKPIITRQCNDDDKIYSFIKKEIEEGHQAYIICPLIESESEAMEGIASVVNTYKEVCEYFKKDKNINIGLINGDMKQAEIDNEIGKFARNEYQILISTTIVEVGVNVPNATVINIKNSERFGIAQLHQLRGRVGRSSIQSYCILQTPNENDIKAKLLCSTNDAFILSEEDLKLRGSGKFFSTEQSGKNHIVDLMLQNQNLYYNISTLTDKIYSDNKLFNQYKFLLDFRVNA